MRKVVAAAVDEHCQSRHPDNWDLSALVAQLQTVFPMPPFEEIPAEEFGETKEAVTDRLFDYAEAAYAAKEADVTETMMRKVEPFGGLKALDSKWISDLPSMAHCNEGRGRRPVSSNDPPNGYQNTDTTA